MVLLSHLDFPIEGSYRLVVERVYPFDFSRLLTTSHSVLFSHCPDPATKDDRCHLWNLTSQMPLAYYYVLTPVTLPFSSCPYSEIRVLCGL